MSASHALEGAPVGADVSGLGVCIVGMHYAPETTGNAPYTTAMANALHAAGADVHVITGVPHYPQWAVLDDRYRRGLSWQEELDGVRVHRYRHAVPSTPDLLGRSRMELSFGALAAAAVARDRSDVIIAVTPMLSGLTAAVIGRHGRPVGVLVQDLTGNGATQSGAAGRTVARAVGSAEYALLRQADRVGVIAPRFAEILVGEGIRRERIADLPNFTHIEPQRISRGAAREALGWPRSRALALHTGNIGMKQGLETVVEAARLSSQSADPVDFMIVGDGNQRARLEDLGSGIDALHFVDPLDAANYPYALAAADVLVLNERPGMVEMSLPSKLTSYVASQRPIVAAVEPTSITAEVLRHSGAAHIVAAGDPAGLLRATREVIGDPQLRARLVNAGMQLLESTYSAARAYERYRAFAASLGELTASRRSGDRC
ncbi:glycosyltransferase family 4 protein [Cellulomonas sp. NS3]|uniref:glycosyltransferase family 4 protein n=1 Tax=Cellulomonas sp. NS3 TaxID=2973977 RepID=UPI0021627DBA|nr:glycosyltransferase family 4 protein [Cellulomonas sp. NS3]